MEDLSLHILDIVENSMDAGATKVEIRIKEDKGADRLTLEVKDNGYGMDKDILKRASDCFFTAKPGKRFGFGIPFLMQAARECDGNFSINSAPNRGTSISASFKRSHIDIKPLGDMGSTMTVLICGHPEIDYLLLYEKNGFSYCLDTEKLKADLGGVPINTPGVLRLIKEDVNEALGTLAKQLG